MLLAKRLMARGFSASEGTIGPPNPDSYWNQVIFYVNFMDGLVDQSQEGKTITSTGSIVDGEFTGNESFYTGPFSLPGDFTFEFIFESYGGVGYLFDMRLGGFSLMVYDSSGVDVFGYGMHLQFPSYAGNTVHLAFVKKDSTMSVFLDGTLQGSYETSLDHSVTAIRFFAHVNDGTRFVGRCDYIRLTESVARYDSTFTPPTFL